MNLQYSWNVIIMPPVLDYEIKDAAIKRHSAGSEASESAREAYAERLVKLYMSGEFDTISGQAVDIVRNLAKGESGILESAKDAAGLTLDVPAMVFREARSIFTRSGVANGFAMALDLAVAVDEMLFVGGKEKAGQASNILSGRGIVASMLELYNMYKGFNKAFAEMSKGNGTSNSQAHITNMILKVDEVREAVLNLCEDKISAGENKNGIYSNLQAAIIEVHTQHQAGSDLSMHGGHDELMRHLAKCINTCLGDEGSKADALKLNILAENERLNTYNGIGQALAGALKHSFEHPSPLMAAAANAVYSMFETYANDVERLNGTDPSSPAYELLERRLERAHSQLNSVVNDLDAAAARPATDFARTVLHQLDATAAPHVHEFFNTVKGAEILNELQKAVQAGIKHNLLGENDITDRRFRVPNGGGGVEVLLGNQFAELVQKYAEEGSWYISRKAPHAIEQFEESPALDKYDAFNFANPEHLLALVARFKPLGIKVDVTPMDIQPPPPPSLPPEAGWGGQRPAGPTGEGGRKAPLGTVLDAAEMHEPTPVSDVPPPPTFGTEITDPSFRLNRQDEAYLEIVGKWMKEGLNASAASALAELKEPEPVTAYERMSVDSTDLLTDKNNQTFTEMVSKLPIPLEPSR
jgi:hypothetical protein